MPKVRSRNEEQRYKGSLGGNRDILYLVCGGDFMILKLKKLYTLNGCHFIVYKLYFNKTDLQRDREVPRGPVDWKGNPSSTEKGKRPRQRLFQVHP